MIINADALHIPMKDKVVQTCVTSPPYYGLRDYGVDGQIGLEETPEQYIEKLVTAFREVWRVMKDDGTLWVNIGDSYAHSLRQSGPEHAGVLANKSKGQIKKGFKPLQEGYKEKDLIGIPWMLAFALRADGWYLRSDIIWSKPNPMPESVKDRPTKAHEYIFLLSKSQRYYYDADAIREPSIDPEASARRYEQPFFVGEKHESGGYSASGQKHTAGMKKFDGARNKRSVWTVTTKPYSGAHFATFPPDLIEPCILAGSAEGDIVLDPFSGSGTTGQVAIKNRRRYAGLELNMDYIGLSRQRTTVDVMLPLMAGKG